MEKDVGVSAEGGLTPSREFHEAGSGGAAPEILSKKIDPPGSLPEGRSERGVATRKEARDSAGRRRYTAAERRELLAAFERSGKTAAEFCRTRSVHPTTLNGWRRQARAGGLPKKKKRCVNYTPAQRRAAVEAFERSGRTRGEFAALWGVSSCTLGNWLKRYAEEGPKGLETRRRAGPGRPRTIPAGVRDAIADTKHRFPDFGMRRVRDWLRRFRGIRVSAGTVQKTLQERGLANAARTPKKKAKKKPPRRFERARPMQLWQSDITSYVLTRHSRACLPRGLPRRPQPLRRPPGRCARTRRPRWSRSACWTASRASASPRRS